MASEDARTREADEQYARQIGLHNLTPEQMEEFVRAGAYMRGLLAKLPRDFAYTEEPAHIFRASEEA